jgi:hypothetical protein
MSKSSMPNNRFSPSPDPEPREQAIQMISGLALSLGAERTEHSVGIGIQVIRLNLDSRAIFVAFEDGIVDRVLTEESALREVRVRLTMAIAKLRTPEL